MGKGRRCYLTDRPMAPHAVECMLKRRLKAAGLLENLSPNSFRVLVITDLLRQNVPLKDVQYLAATAHLRSLRFTTGAGRSSPATSSSGSSAESSIAKKTGKLTCGSSLSAPEIPGAG